jgi:hypothetical protein
MRKAIVLFAAAFCGSTFAASIPTDHRMPSVLAWLNFASLAWIGSYCIYKSLTKRPEV